MTSSLAMHQTTTRLGELLTRQRLIIEDLRVFNLAWLGLARSLNALASFWRTYKQEFQGLKAENRQLRNQYAQLLKENQRLTYEVHHDSLTRLYNRRYFDRYSEQACQTASQSGNGLSLLVIDIDYFKRYNDTYSHQGGDQLLHRFGQCLLEVVQTSDNCVARYGGEEFVVVLPNHDQAAARAVAETIQNVVSALGITVSIGVACYGKDGKTPLELFHRADHRLYAAKQSGRNCIVTSEKSEKATEYRQV